MTDGVNPMLKAYRRVVHKIQRPGRLDIQAVNEDLEQRASRDQPSPHSNSRANKGNQTIRIFTTCTTTLDMK